MIPGGHLSWEDQLSCGYCIDQHNESLGTVFQTVISQAAGGLCVGSEAFDSAVFAWLEQGLLSQYSCCCHGRDSVVAADAIRGLCR